MKTFTLLTLFFLFNLHAEDTNSTQENNATQQEHYIDTFHKRASEHVKRLSGFADETLVDMADYLENKEVNLTEDAYQGVSQDNKDAVDSFFLNDKYLDSTDKSYVSIRPEARFQSKDDDDFNLKVSAHLDLSKSQKRFKLFVNELNQDNADDLATEDEEKSTPEIGMNYFAPDFRRIKSKYSIGIRGIYPFVRARYSAEYHPGSWIIEPIQTFKYSVKDDFEEQTQVFFDTKLTKLSLLRFYLSRGTESRVSGMAYDGSMGIYYSPTKGTGLSITQYFNASTKYQHTENENAIPVIYEDYNGIFNYGTEFTIRQNFWRDWLFYELRPGVNFHKRYDYEANYTIRMFLDIFVGNL